MTEIKDTLVSRYHAIHLQTSRGTYVVGIAGDTDTKAVWVYAHGPGGSPALRISEIYRDTEFDERIRNGIPVRRDDDPEFVDELYTGLTAGSKKQ